jgi:succinate dehydrogenase flavin-adding protein (antitoxin of CptAB toxin-antitoxin module)
MLEMDLLLGEFLDRIFPTLDSGEQADSFITLG